MNNRLTLYPPQQKSHDLLVAALRNHPAALDASCVGSGKTVKAAEIARTLGLKPFVVAPKAVLPSWIRALDGQEVPFEGVTNYEKLRNGRTVWLKKVGKAYEWTLPEGTLLIFDEVHKAKGVLTQNAKMIIAAARQKIPMLMLSATAAENPSEMRALGYALGLHQDKNFATWAKNWGCGLDPFRKWYFPAKNRHRLVELHDLIFPDKGHKVSRDEMGAFFSETSIITEAIDFGANNQIEALYAEMQVELDALAQLSSADRGANSLTAILRARQHIELTKIPVLAEMVNETVAEGRSAAVFLNFRASMDALAERLVAGVPAVFIHGGQSAAERQHDIDAFQADDAHVILAQIAAGGVGVSLHDVRGVRPRTSFISPTYSAKEIDQALGRIDRAGAKSDTIQRILFAADTIEEEVARSFRAKLQNMKILLKDLDPDVPSHNVVSSMTTDADATAPESPTPPPEEKPAHAKWSPSKLKYVELCPGFDGREGTVNPAAEMGTRIHEALEKMDLDILTDNWERLIGERCLEAYQNIVERHGWEGKSYQTLHEVRLEIELGAGLETFGTCDVLLTLGDTGIAIDWKTGKGSIDDASINTQAQAYTLGSFQRHPELKVIHFYFVCPQRDEVTFHTYLREDCPRIALRLNTIIRRGEQFQHVWKNRGGVPVEMFNPQPNLCEFCANQWKCHAVTEKVFDIARKYGTDGLPVPDLVHGSETDDPEDLAKMLRLKPVIQAWLDGIGARAKQMAFEEGTEIPGFEPKERAGRRSISSASAAWDALITMVPDLTTDDFMARLGTVSFNDVVDIVKDAAPPRKKTAYSNAFEDKLIEMGVLDQAPPSQYLAVKR
jgi:superfamily II DNA or RNA helicase